MPPLPDRKRGRPRSGSPAIGSRAAAVGLPVQLGEPLRLLVGDPEPGVGHAERTEDPLGEVRVERLPGHHLDDPPQHVRGDRVVPLGARVELQRQTRVHLRGPGEIRTRQHRRLQPGRPVQRVHGMGVVEGERQARRVRHQMPYEQRPGGRTGAHLVAGAALVHPGLRELRQMTAHRVVQRQPALLHQHQRAHGRHRLGHGVDPPQRVALHGQPGRHVPRPVRREVRDPAAPGDRHEEPGQLPLVDPAGEVPVQTLQRPRVQPGLPRTGLLPQHCHRSPWIGFIEVSPAYPARTGSDLRTSEGRERRDGARR